MFNCVEIMTFLKTSVGRSSPLWSTLLTNLIMMKWLSGPGLSPYESPALKVPNPRPRSLDWGDSKILLIANSLTLLYRRSSTYSYSSLWPVHSPGHPPPGHSSDTSGCSPQPRSWSCIINPWNREGWSKLYLRASSTARVRVETALRVLIIIIHILHHFPSVSPECRAGGGSTGDSLCTLHWPHHPRNSRMWTLEKMDNSILLCP